MQASHDKVGQVLLERGVQHVGAMPVGLGVARIAITFDVGGLRPGQCVQSGCSNASTAMATQNAGDSMRESGTAAPRQPCTRRPAPKHLITSWSQHLGASHRLQPSWFLGSTLLNPKT